MTIIILIIKKLNVKNVNVNAMNMYLVMEQMMLNAYATIHIGSMTYFLELAIEEIVNAKNLILNLLAIVEKDMIHIKL
jgi:hypothetical protein